MAYRLPFGEGASINRPPLFCGLNYQFWKVRMKLLQETIDKKFSLSKQQLKTAV